MTGFRTSLKTWLPGVWYPGESISLGLDTPVSQSPWGLILWWVNLPRVWYPGESISLGSVTPVSQSPWGLIPWWVNLPGVWYPGESISPGFETLASQSPRGLNPRWVNLPGAETPRWVSEPGWFKRGQKSHWPVPLREQLVMKHLVRECSVLEHFIRKKLWGFL